MLSIQQQRYGHEGNARIRRPVADTLVSGYTAHGGQTHTRALIRVYGITYGTCVYTPAARTGKILLSSRRTPAAVASRACVWYRPDGILVGRARWNGSETAWKHAPPPQHRDRGRPPGPVLCHARRLLTQRNLWVKPTVPVSGAHVRRRRHGNGAVRTHAAPPRPVARVFESGPFISGVRRRSKATGKPQVRSENAYSTRSYCERSTGRPFSPFDRPKTTPTRTQTLNTHRSLFYDLKKKEINLSVGTEMEVVHTSFMKHIFTQPSRWISW